MKKTPRIFERPKNKTMDFYVKSNHKFENI